MAVKNYIATADGYVDGRVIKAGEAFTTEFKEVVREAPTKREGRPDLPGAIKRNKDGTPVLKAGKAPSWARLADEAEYAAAQAGDDTITDPNFEEMEPAALQAYAAERGVPFDKKTSKEDLIAAIKAAVDYTR